MFISVIICTHNPDTGVLHRTLTGLEQQDLPKTAWGLLLVDNCSSDPLCGRVDLSWHPSSKIVTEEKLGLTNARLRGISESNDTELFVFVDDDNVLSPNYLSNAKRIASEFKWIGAFGGSVLGEFATPPAPELTFLLPHLALREVTAVGWACRTGLGALEVSPWGAGMVIRREVAQDYLALVCNDPLRMKLDRVGESLCSSGDTDMALCACRRGLAVGLFPDLHVLHLIPSKRSTEDYLTRLAEGNAFSHAVLRYVWEKKLPPPSYDVPPCLSDRFYRLYKSLRRRWRRETDTVAERVEKLEARARLRAREMLLSL